MFIDTHAHLFKEYYSDLDDVILECLNNGVNKIGSSGESNKVKDKDLITESNIDALRQGYNNALIRSGLPSNPSGAPNTCCQLKQSCMTKASGRPSLQPCANGQTCPQSPLH